MSTKQEPLVLPQYIEQAVKDYVASTYDKNTDPSGLGGIMSDEEFAVLFPDAGEHWEHDARWLLLTISISERLSKLSGLPIDFQFQPQTHANARHKGLRSAMGLKIARSK